MALQPVAPGVPTQSTASTASSFMRPSSIGFGLLSTMTTRLKFFSAMSRSASSLGVSCR